MFRIILASFAFIALVPTGAAQTHVDGHTRRDGTYVAPHYRSAPDKSYNNNWNVSPNANPYTGERGRDRPTLDDRPPSPSPYGNSHGRPLHR